MPDVLRDVVRRALARLLDYQDARYARRYLERLAAFVPPPGPAAIRTEVAVAVARALALWMAYEDAVRVAELKTRASRFDRIRVDTGAPDAVIAVTDYLKPDLDELWGVLPYGLVAPLAAWARRRWPHGRPTLGQRIRTTTVSGFLRVRLLTWLRPLRPVSYRAREEHARIDRWLEGVRDALRVSEAAALELARAGLLVKGYGEVRRRLAGLLDALLDAAREACVLEAATGGDGAIAAALVARFRGLVLEGPDGEARAPALAAETLARLREGDAAGARALTTV